MQECFAALLPKFLCGIAIALCQNGCIGRKKAASYSEHDECSGKIPEHVEDMPEGGLPLIMKLWIKTKTLEAKSNHSACREVNRIEPVGSAKNIWKCNI